MRLPTFLLSAILTPAFALASPQQERAVEIEEMTNTYGFAPHTPNYLGEDLPRAASVVLLDGCVMTTVNTFENMFTGEFRAMSTQNDLGSLIFGRSGDPQIYQTLEIQDEPTVVGSIFFRTDGQVKLRAHANLPTFLGPREALGYPITGTSGLEYWYYTNARMTEIEIARIAQALLAYQRDFCAYTS